VTLVAALATGLLGSFGHCLGMCGPIAGAVGVAAAGGPAAAAGKAGLLAAGRVQLAYHAGRIATYGFLGFLMGLGGSFVNTAGRLAGVQQAVQVLAGAGMILLGLGALGVAGFARRVEQRLASRLFGAARGVLAGGGPARAFPLGLVLGFLPCGLSYSAFVAAAATGDPARGLALALAFGLGTAPALLLAGSLAGAIGPRLRGALYRAGGALVVLFGAAFLLRGLGLRAPL
jgi:sulfite exporter TauE/SafE